MFKYFLLLAFSLTDSLAMTIAYGEINEISKNDVLLIVTEAENLGIPKSLEINKIKSWRDGKLDAKRYFEYVSIDFEPHKEDGFYKIFYTLHCNNRNNHKWTCQKDDNIRIRFDLKQDKNIIVYNQSNVELGVLVEVARAANNLRPMSWDRPISKVFAQKQRNYIVTFGTEASCARSLVIKRDFDDNGDLYKVVWDKFSLYGCRSIAGYIDTSKRYVVYENGKWISE